MGAGINRNYNPRTGAWTRPPKKRQKNGCYIATAVYGSYDCPEVWTLRRYRDYHLANSIWGRVFISVYYSFSPVIVKLFGKAEWFNKLFHRYLDNKVSALKSKGYSSSKYEDNL